MPVIEIRGHKYDVDEDGFLQSPEVWNDTVACDLATTEGLADLTEDHWKVVRYIRSYWQENNSVPMARKLCKETGFTLQQLYDLFPSGPVNGACKLAGLSKPPSCA